VDGRVRGDLLPHVRGDQRDRPHEGASNGGGAPAPDALLITLVAFAHGGALALAVYSLGSVSGAHVSPAISFSLFIARKISPKDFAFYVLFQVVGAVVAGMEAHLSHELGLAACRS
jgi:glycerol uptake facilitator-like aquaporin